MKTAVITIDDSLTLLLDVEDDVDHDGALRTLALSVGELAAVVTRRGTSEGFQLDFLPGRYEDKHSLLKQLDCNEGDWPPHA